MPLLLCFACPCLLAYFREATNLHCAHEACPCFLLEGGPCLLGLPAQNICYQATVRPAPLQTGIVYTPSGFISQQHYISLAGFPHLTERNLISLPVSYSHTMVFSSPPLNSFLLSQSTRIRAARNPVRLTKLKTRLGSSFEVVQEQAMLNLIFRSGFG